MLTELSRPYKDVFQSNIQDDTTKGFLLYLIMPK